jgi:rhamnosyltransferase
MMDLRTAPPSATNVCAVVVAYYPDEGFETRLERVLPQVAMLLIVDNTPEGGFLSESFQRKWAETLYFIGNHANKGVAIALNQGLDFAAKRGCPWLLTLDQDTHCYPNMVSILSKAYAQCEKAPAVIGANYLDRQNHRIKVKTQSKMEYVVQKTVITSGCLVDVSIAMSIHGFREDYFIDQVDHEFCLRIRSVGKQVVITSQPAMEHAVGQSGGAWIPLLGILPNHPPIRKYYIARNTLVTVAQYWRIEPVWCAKRLIRLFLGLLEMALLERHRLRKVHAFFAGIVDGVRQRMGICQKVWLQQQAQE